MSKKYFKLQMLIFSVTLTISLVCRIILKFSFIDPQTGLYTSHGLIETVFNVLLVLLPLVLFVGNRIKKANNDYPVYQKDPVASILAVIVGVSICYFVGYDIGYAIGKFGEYGLFAKIVNIAIAILGLASAVSFCIFGIKGYLGKLSKNTGLMLIFPSMWMILVLLVAFRKQPILTSYSDNLLIMLFMLFASLFFVGHGRTACGLMRKDGRNYTIPAGLCTALFGIIACLPNLLYAVLNGNTQPTLITGTAGFIFMLALSLYAIKFVFGMTKAIKYV